MSEKELYEESFRALSYSFRNNGMLNEFTIISHPMMRKAHPGFISTCIRVSSTCIRVRRGCQPFQ